MKTLFEKHQTLLAGILLAVGLVMAGQQLRQGLTHMKDGNRVVQVKGLAERDVLADKATWALVYKELGNDPALLCQIIEEKNAKVVAFLKGAGLSDEEIIVNPPTIIDRQADHYGNEILNHRYKASSAITVTSGNVQLVRQLVTRQTELLKQGVAIVRDEYSPSAVYYEFTGLNDIKPEMVQEATRNARATAEKFAEDSNSRLGGIRSATQGQFSIENTDETTPHIKHVRVVTTIDYMIE